MTNANTRPRCIITGCALQLAGSRHVVAGDLHALGRDIFIFNGNVERGEFGICARWIPEEENIYGRRIKVPVGYNYFERRGVFIMAASRSLLNAEALEYLADEAEELPE